MIEDLKKLQAKNQEQEQEIEQLNLIIEQEKVKETLSIDREFNYQFILRMDEQNKQLNSIAQQLYQISEILSKFVLPEEEPKKE